MEKAIISTVIKDRKILLISWFFFFILNGGIIVFIHLNGWIQSDNFYMAIKQWNALYAPYIGAITLFYWGSSRRSLRLKPDKTRIGFYIAIACSVLWNISIVIFLLPPLFGTGGIENAMDNINEITFSLSCLVAVATGYYFASPLAN